MHVDNRTPYICKIFWSGEYLGTVGSYGDGYFYSSPGQATWYARADFTDGTTMSVGPRSGQVEAGEVYTWTIR